MPLDPILAAIAHHRQARDAFQVAPEDKDGVDACCEMQDALDAVLTTLCAPRPGVGADVVSGISKDRAVPGRGKASQAIRYAAAEAENRRLNDELPRIVESAQSDLFGPEGKNPSWALIEKGAR